MNLLTNNVFSNITKEHLSESKFHYQDIVILLTATIDVQNIPFLQRSDLKIRLSDYKQSLKLWMNNKHTPKIIFCENSGFDLSPLSELCKQNNPHHKKIEFLSLDDNHFPRELGKGYGEMRIIKHVFEKSHLIGPDTLIIKVTGRLYIAEIGTIINNIQNRPKADIYCNFKGDLSHAECYIFCSSVLFLKDYLFPRKELINDTKGVFFEHVLARAVHASLSDGYKYSILPGFLDIRGINGTRGDIYTRSFISRIKGFIFYRLKLFVLFREG